MSRILLVEDDLGHRSLMEDRLRKTGFDVLGCGSIADARQRLSSAGWDAVLLDQRLPDGEGLDLMADLRQASPGLPIILVTALGGEDVAVRALRSGVDDYLTKDIGLSYLDALPVAVQRQLERVRLRQAHEALEARIRQREKSEAFHAMMLGLADKLNNRLAGALGYLELVAQGLPEGESVLRGQVARARESAQRAADILRVLLEHTIGLDQLQIQSIPVPDLLRQVRQHYPGLCPPEREVEILPAATACEQICEALLALVRNAEEASGGVEGVRVTAAASGDGRWVELRVTDRGEGIAAENLPKVLLPFFTTRGTKPAGLGLWQAYQIVSHVGGRMSISSRQGAGTTVRVELPVAAAPQDQGEAMCL
jgi:signal transduction histidine kinase